MLSYQPNTYSYQELLYNLKFIRAVEEEIAKEYPKQEMRCPTHLSIGQEAVAVGVCANLSDHDFVVSGHRAHAHYLGKGGSLNAMIAEIYGKVTGCCQGKGGSMHLVDTSVGFMGSTAIVGGTIPIGVGLGLSIQTKKEDRISTIFLGEGACEEGVFYESANFTATKNLPVLFICENNLYSVYSPLHVRQPESRKLHEMIKAIGINSDYGNGNDVIEVLDKTQKATEYIKTEKKPCFLEFYTYRHREHCGPNFDNDIGYRTPEEFKKWEKEDPVTCFQNKLLQESILNKNDILKIEAQIQNQIQEAFDFAKRSDFPDEQEIYTHLFKD